MNLDALAQQLRVLSSDNGLQRLADLLVVWQTNDHTATDLRDEVEKYFGNSWMVDNEDFERAYELWSGFRDQFIDGIGGLTMNERLYWFCLFERFEASDDCGRRIVYAKLQAAP